MNRNRGNQSLRTLLSLWLLVTLPAAAQAQDYTCTTNSDGTLTITKYTGSGGAVTIPTNINSLTVTSIGSFAFANDSSLTAITIPDSITSVGSGAFRLCTSLTSVTIPRSVTNVADLAFFYCPSLSAITVDPGNSFYSSEAGILFNKGQTALIVCPAQAVAGTYMISNGVTSIGDDAFDSCTNLTNVTMGSSVTSIGAYAFQLCSGLKSVVIPDSVTSLGANAFDSCSGLTSVSIGNSVSNIGPQTFLYCGRLTNVTIGTSVTSIGDGAFASTALISITIPDSVTSIGGNAFDSCGGLTSITIPGGVTNIGSEAFFGCSGLTSVTVGNSVTSLGVAPFIYCPVHAIYFRGDAPSPIFPIFSTVTNVTVYHFRGSTGWGQTIAGFPAVLWNPQMQTSDGNFGVRTNQFGFNVTGASNLVVVVEASPSLVNPVWTPLQTNTPSGDSFYFSDPLWSNYPSRFYGLRWP